MKTQSPAAIRSLPLLAGALALASTLGCEPRTDGTADPLDERTEAPASDPTVLPVADASGVQGGTFSMSASDIEVEPAGCRSESKGDWAFELPAPQAGEWQATERFDTHATPYTCSGSSGEFECTTRQGFNYGPTGVDADVELVVTYAGAWSDDERIAGNFDLVFTCEGEECAQVASQWTVGSFPCGNSGRFEGAL